MRAGAEICKLAAAHRPARNTISCTHAALGLLAWMAMFAVINLRLFGY